MESKELTELLNKPDNRLLRRYWVACRRWVDEGNEEELTLVEILEKEILRRMDGGEIR